MALVRKYQNSFTSGVLSPAVYARVDLQKYASGCRQIVNGVVHAHGGVSKRPGTRLIDEISGEARLIPFAYNVEQTYVLVFMDKKMRVCMNGGLVTVPGTGGAVEIDTPYSLEDARALKFAQSADTLFLAHPKHPPRTLVRRDHHIWEFKSLEFRPPIDPPQNLTAKASGFTDSTNTYVKTTADYKVAAVDAQERESEPSNVATADILSTWPTKARVKLKWDRVPGAVRYEVYKNTRGYWTWLGSADENEFTDDNIEGDDSIGPKENRDPFNPLSVPENVSVERRGSDPEEGTILVRVSSVNSAGVESLPSEQLSVPGPREALAIEWDRVPDADYFVYFKEGNAEWEYASVAESAASATSEDFRMRFLPSETTNCRKGAPQEEIRSYPGAVGIYQQRLVFGRSDSEPQTVWLSETGAFDSMAVAHPLRDDSAITATVDSKQMNEIRHFIPLKDMLMLTSGAEFKMSSGLNSDAVTPTSLRFDLQSYWGSSDIPPVVTGNNVLLVENSGLSVRDLYYQLSDDGYVGNDITILAEHLLTSPVRDWAFQQDPYSSVWVCLESGKLLSLTYMREQEVCAWAEHESSGGKFRSVASIREGSKDCVYFVVKRGEKYFLETLAAREFGDPVEESFFVDCGLSYAGDPVQRITGLSHLAGQKVAILADGSVVRDKVVADDGSVNLPFPASRIQAGLPFTFLLETLDPEIKAQEGSLVGEKRTVVRAVVMVRESTAPEVGPAENRLIRMKFPVPEKYGDPPVLFSGTVQAALKGDHREEACVLFRHGDPLPFTLLSVLTHVGVG